MRSDPFCSGKERTLIIVKNKRMILVSVCLFKIKVLLDTDVYIGKNGFSVHKTEGDMKTPIGIYNIGMAFGREEKPDTELDYIKITKDHYFVDDISSRFYNTLADNKKCSADWNTAEHLIDYKEYDYVLDIGYNAKCKKGRGSAVFLHSKGDKDNTAGCIAANKADVLFCIKHLKRGSKIVIIP